MTGADRSFQIQSGIDVILKSIAARNGVRLNETNSGALKNRREQRKGEIMPLSTKTFYSLFEAAARWGCGMPKIVDWSAGGKICMVTFIRYAESDDGPIAGRVEIIAGDVLSHFRIDGFSQREMRIYRARVEDGAAPRTVFLRGEDGKPGIPVTPHDLYIPGEDFVRFQDEYNLGAIIKEKVIYRTPASERHDWEAMYRRLCKRIFDSGLPEHLQELAREMREWFIMESADGEAPDLSTIRKRLQPIWNELRDAG